MGEVIDLQDWRARRHAAAKPPLSDAQPPWPRRLGLGLAVMLSVPLIVTLLAMAA